MQSIKEKIRLGLYKNLNIYYLKQNNNLNLVFILFKVLFYKYLKVI